MTTPTEDEAREAIDHVAADLYARAFYSRAVRRNTTPPGFYRRGFWDGMRYNGLIDRRVVSHWRTQTARAYLVGLRRGYRQGASS